jgi:O-antigen/teichoic acid export membrane protein
MISLITGLVFTLLLTRSLDKGQFGTWMFVDSVVGPFILISGIFPFWATRFAARGKEGAIKTAVTTNLIVGLVAATIYLPFLPLIMSGFQIDSAFMIVYILASISIQNTFLISILEGCLRAVKPQATGYGLLIEEVVKVSLALILIVGLKQLLLGAIISLVVASSIQAVFYVWLLGGYLKQKVRWIYVKEWLKGSTAFVYNAIGAQLFASTLYLLFLFGGADSLGDYRAATTFAVVIGYASSLAFALYPKMLAQEDRPDDMALSFKTMLMLALPMSAVGITMSQSLLVILNASYGVAAPVLSLLIVDGLIVLISNFYTQCLMGTENFDEQGKISFRKLAKSKIFKVFTLPYIQAAIALPVAYWVLTHSVFSDPALAAQSVVVITIFVHLLTFAAFYLYMHREVKIYVAWKSTAKYVLASLAIAGVLYVLPQTTTLTTTFAKVFSGAGIYIVLLYVIDADARKLFRQIWAEIRGTFR